MQYDGYFARRKKRTVLEIKPPRLQIEGDPIGRSKNSSPTISSNARTGEGSRGRDPERRNRRRSAHSPASSIARRRTSASKPTHRRVAKSARLGRTINAPVDDDAAESLRKGGRGVADWRTSRRRRGVLPARRLPVYLRRNKIVSMAVRTFLRRARTQIFL